MFLRTTVLAALLLVLAPCLIGAARSAAPADAPHVAPSAASTRVESGQPATLSGTVSLLDGEDIREQPVRYLALVLDAPLRVHDEDAGEDSITVVTLWPPKQDDGFAERMQGRHIRAEGRLLYYGAGPSTAPNPWKLALERWH